MSIKFVSLKLLYFLPIPLIINLIFNILLNKFQFSFQNITSKTEALNLLLSLSIYIFYILLGKFLKQIFKTNYVTSAIVIFWLIIFSLDNILIYVTKNFNFKNFIQIVLLVTLIIFLYKRFEPKKIFQLIASFVIVKLVFRIALLFDTILFINIDSLVVSDERRLWYPALKIIYETNYYFALTNNPFPGYGLFSSYINSINTYFLVGSEKFEYYPGISYLFIFLFFTFIYEVTTKRNYFIYISLLFLPMILSSHFFTYLFFGSLMSEVVVSFCFGVLATEIFVSEKYNNLILYIFSFGFLYYTRQFISTIVILIVISKIIFQKKLIYSVGLIGYFVNFLQTSYLPSTFPEPFSTSFINSVSRSSFNLNLINLTKTIKQFLVDKPISYFVIIFLVFLFLNLYNQSKYLNFYLTILLNLLLVLILMIFLWKKTEVESSYRYIMIIFYLFIYPLSRNIEFSLSKLSSER